MSAHISGPSRLVVLLLVASFASTLDCHRHSWPTGPSEWPDRWGTESHWTPAPRSRRSTTPAGSNFVAGFLLSASGDALLDAATRPADAKLAELLERNGPDMRPARDYHDYKDIGLDVSKRAWTVYHESWREAIGRRVEAFIPLLDELIGAANVSADCSRAVHATLDAAKELESWAVKMLNSWGRFPTSGLFEGTYGDQGAFHTCVGLEPGLDSAPAVGHAHYCSVTFRPVVPSMEDYELIVRHLPGELIHGYLPDAQVERTEGKRSALSDLLEHAHYHHYVYYKLGTCWPIACSPYDVRRLAKLVARRNVLLSGPVKCYSTHDDDYEYGPNATLITNEKTKSPLNPSARQLEPLVISTWNKNDGIYIWKPHFGRAHKVALTILGLLSASIVIMSLADLMLNRLPKLWAKFMLSLHARPLRAENNHDKNKQPTSPIGFHTTSPIAGESNAPCEGVALVPSTGAAAHDGSPPGKTVEPKTPGQRGGRSLLLSLVEDCSLFTNVAQFFRVSESQMKNDILCLNGIRCITMVWIIMAHTMMYNEWSGFARTREIEKSLNSLIAQPLFNGSYLVDTFFIMSGLLTAYNSFKQSQGVRKKFNSIAHILGRWLRLTPQIFLVSMVLIVFPAISYGPHWYPYVGEYSENCASNWWINVLHLQSFWKKEEMCNFVTWWVSIDFFYHFLALGITLVFLNSGHKVGIASILALVAGSVIYQSMEHYRLKLPPNVLSTIPQTGEMWTTMTLSFFWTPYTHAVPYFSGFYTGYLMALKKKTILRNLNTRRSLIGWILSIGSLLGQSYSTYWWVTGKANYTPLGSTVYYGACSMIWTASLCWIIVACHHGYGGFINATLSSKVFIVLGKASYVVYLSHFQVMFVFFGNQNLLLEPTMLVMFYVIVGNILLSALWGIFQCSVFELPWLKIQRRLMKYV